MLKARILTVLVLLPLLLAALFLLENEYWAVLMLLVLLIGASEWSKIAGFSSITSWLYAAGTFALGMALLFVADFDSGKMTASNLFFYSVSLIFWVLAVPVWLAKGWRIHNRFMLALVGVIVLIPTWLALVQLQAMSPSFLLALMAVVWVADIFAYFTGRRFGKHKLAPSISPGKTWEGVVGAFMAVAVYALIWMGQDDKLLALVSGINFSPWITIILAVWVMTYFGILGDLFESWMKRQAGLKDSGHILPGHGGVLDRIDALTSSLPLAALVLLLLHSSASYR